MNDTDEKTKTFPWQFHSLLEASSKETQTLLSKQKLAHILFVNHVKTSPTLWKTHVVFFK
jgi:hypothetical protein